MSALGVILLIHFSSNSLLQVRADNIQICQNLCSHWRLLDVLVEEKVGMVGHASETLDRFCKKKCSCSRGKTAPPDENETNPVRFESIYKICRENCFQTSTLDAMVTEQGRLSNMTDNPMLLQFCSSRCSCPRMCKETCSDLRIMDLLLEEKVNLTGRASPKFNSFCRETCSCQSAKISQMNKKATRRVGSENMYKYCRKNCFETRILNVMLEAHGNSSMSTSPRLFTFCSNRCSCEKPVSEAVKKDSHEISATRKYDPADWKDISWIGPRYRRKYDPADWKDISWIGPRYRAQIIQANEKKKSTIKPQTQTAQIIQANEKKKSTIKPQTQSPKRIYETVIKPKRGLYCGLRLGGYCLHDYDDYDLEGSENQYNY